MKLEFGNASKNCMFPNFCNQHHNKFLLITLVNARISVGIDCF